MRLLFDRWILVSAALLVAAPASAQLITTGTVKGVVRDQQGLALPAVTVEVLSEATGDVRQTVTNETGAFSVPALPQGRYTLKAGLDGFRPYEQRGIQLRSGETFDAGTVTLGVGAINETTTVTADLAVVQTASAERTSVLESTQLDSLIVRGRDPMALLNMMPGVTPVTNVASLGGQIGPATPAIAGQVGAAAGLALDGMASSDGDTGRNNSPMSVDAIEEVRVVLNNYQAEFGRNTGAQINIVSKSGTRTFHGSLASYVRHESLNANSFFNVRNGLEKPLYRYKTLAGTLGGPVLLPGIVRRDRTFFFYVREMWDVKEPRTARTATMPTALERTGDFSQTVDLNGRLIPIIDPGTGAQFSGNRIPSGRINAFGQAILNLLPQPNFLDRSISGGNYNYRDQDISTQTKALDQLKIDHNLGERDRLSVRWRRWRPVTEAYSGVFAVNSNFNHFRHGYAQREDSVQVNHTRTLGTAIVNELSGSWRYAQEVGPTIDTLDPMTRSPVGLGALGQLFPQANPNGIIPQATFGGVPSAVSIAYDGRFPIDAGDDRYVLADNLSWAKGRHLLKGGVYYERNNNSEGPNGACYGGCFNFAHTDRNNPLNTGYAFANALLGNFLSYTEGNGRPEAKGHTQFVEWFIQDSWKVRSNLTFDLGLRFAWGQPWKLFDGQQGASWVADAFSTARQPRLFRPAIANGQRVGRDGVTGQTVPAALIGALVPGSGDFFNGMVTQDSDLGKNGFRSTPPIQPQPRLGFSWDPEGKGKMAIRGGFGITKQVLQDSGDWSFRHPSAPPVRLQPQVFYANIATMAASQGFFFPENVPSYEKDYEVPTTYNFSFEVQRNVGLSTVVSAAYVGNRQRYLTASRNLNQIAPGARFAASNIDPTTGLALPDAFLRPYIGFGNITYLENTGYANYDSLQITANRRFSHGLSYGGAYTLSRTRDIGGTLPLYRDTREFLYDFSSNDRRHLVTTNFTWNLPNGSRAWNNVAARALLDHWQIAAVGLFASGAPAGIGFTTTDNADILGGGDGSRINVRCDPLLSSGERTFNRWFDTSCFARPARGDAGNAKRQVIWLPGSRNWDLTVSKNFPIGHSERRLQFRAELYNAFNYTNWTNVDTTARFDTQGNQISPTFGQVSAAGEPRVIQLSLRFQF